MEKALFSNLYFFLKTFRLKTLEKNKLELLIFDIRNKFTIAILKKRLLIVVIFFFLEQRHRLVIWNGFQRLFVGFRMWRTISHVSSFRDLSTAAADSSQLVHEGLLHSEVDEHIQQSSSASWYSEQDEPDDDSEHLGVIARFDINHRSVNDQEGEHDDVDNGVSP